MLILMSISNINIPIVIELIKIDHCAPNWDLNTTSPKNIIKGISNKLNHKSSSTIKYQTIKIGN
jgi:hypothetical protein